MPIAEADRTEPINPYGATKLAFEGAMRWFAAEPRLPRHQPALLQRRRRRPSATARTTSPRRTSSRSCCAWRPARRPTSRSSAQDYPTPDGTCIRDYIHVRDLAAAHLLALEATGEGDPSFEVYNLGSAAGFSVREVVEAARKVTGRAIPARAVKRRMGDPPVLVASSRRARRALGWHLRHSKLEEMLADAWAWKEGPPRPGTAAPRETRMVPPGRCRTPSRREPAAELTARPGQAPAARQSAQRP